MNISEINDVQKEENEKYKNKPQISYTNSIEFISEMEKIYIKNKNLKEKKIYQLNNNKSSKSKDYIKVINDIPKTSLSSLIFKQGIIITSMTVNKNNIYIGTNKGETRVYNWKTEKKLNYLINSEITRESKKDVICMDASDDNKVLVVGHLNGYILLWDIETAECKKLIQGEFNTQIVAIKFSLIEKGFYEFLASDLKGSVKRLGVNEGFFFNSVNSNYVIDYTHPIFIIEVLQLTKEQKIVISKYNHNEDQEEPLIVAFGSLDFVFIVQLEPEIKRLYNFKKPSYIKGSFVPDLCFGIGQIPAPLFHSKDFSEEEISNMNNKNSSKTNTDSDIISKLDLSKSYQFIFVSWGKIIHIFMISFDLNDFLSIYLVGHFINNESIIRMGFLSNSIIYILNIYKKFKILNTKFMNQGEIKFDSEGIIIDKYSDITQAELCSEFGLDHEILFQTYIPEIDSINKNMFKSTYNNLVFSQEKNIFAVCKKNIYLGCLLNWEQCINELFKNSEWLNAFKLGIDIYHGKNKVLDGVPINVKDRKEIVKKILKGLILQLILNTINIKGIFYNEQKSEEILSECINVSIELCLDVNELDYLLKEILPVLEEKGYFNFFIEKVKPFILNRKIDAMQLGQNIMSKILNYYLNLNDYITLSRLIVNIDIKNFDINEIKDICNNKSIILPLIYINFKTCENDDLFLLIKKIYDLFKKADNISKEEYENYKDDIIYNKIDNSIINEIQINKQYLGQKLLWFINLCLEGKKYPTQEKINKKIYINLIQKIFLWLINDEILNELLIFDSYSYFFIFSKFFIDDSLYDGIQKIKYNDNKSLFDGIIYNGKNLEKINIKIVIEIILNKVNSYKNVLINDDFNEFILKINSHNQILSKDYIINSINYFLNFKTKNEEREGEEDFFGFHPYKALNDDDKIDKYSSDINAVLEKYKNKLDKKEFNKILVSADKNQFPLVCIRILQLINDNIKCLDVYLDNNKIKNKEDKIFEFINNFMSKAGKDEKKNYEIELIKRVDKLVELSVEKLVNLSIKWFNKEQLSIIEKLSTNNEKKLKYIKEYINYYKENNINEEKEKNNKDDHYYKILIIHIETLCKMDKKKDIIKLLKEDPLYLNNECLKVCLKNNVFDAAIYIYMHQKNFTEALNLCKKEITNNIDNLIKIYTDNSMNDINKKELFSEHDEIISKCCFICEKESEQLPKKEGKKIWFDMLEFLYNKIEMGNTKQKKFKINLDEIKTKISEDINNFILKMYPHTDMKSLLNEIYKKTEMTDFKGFNNILNCFVKEQIIYKDIFNKIKSLLDYTISDNFKEKTSHNIKGIQYPLEKCDFCHKIFKDNENILLLKCGHIVHKNRNCCFTNNNKYNTCRICYDNKIKESIGSFDEEEYNLNDILKDEKNENEKEVNDKKKKNDLTESFNKINMINDKFMQRYSIIDIDIGNIKRKETKDKNNNENKKNS